MKKNAFLVASLFAFIGELYANGSPNYTYRSSVNYQFDLGTTYFSYGMFQEENDEHKGVEMGALVHSKTGYGAFRPSLTYFEGEESEQNIDGFLGASITGYMHMNWRFINPYLGVGIFQGQTNYCSDVEEENGECKEDLMLSIYPEVAVAVNLSHLHFFFYARHYYDTQY